MDGRVRSAKGIRFLRGWLRLVGHRLGDVKQFQSRVVVLGEQGSPTLEPVPQFAMSMSERDLEAQIVNHPELLGEELLVLGSQLAEFAEDRDRLDVLAVDRDGELVLVELKVDDAFRVTDLQALAYAGAYSTASPAQLARTFARSFADTSDDSSIEQARKEITTFVSNLDEFEDWQPSRQVRIKLVAPSFPARVLATVKWLGDVYGMPIEVIQAQLFSDQVTGHHILTFKRLLPVKSDREFDLKVREEQKRIRGGNLERRPDILKTLITAGELHHADELWYLTRSYETPPQVRAAKDDDPRLRVTLDTTESQPRFRWTNPEGVEHVLSPSAAWSDIIRSIDPEFPEPRRRYRSVYRRYSRTPGGEPLGDLAETLGLWDTNDAPE